MRQSCYTPLATTEMLTLPKLRAVRDRYPLSQEALAARSGVNRVTISRLEMGHPARPETVRRLADALGVQPAALFGADDGPAAR